MEPFASPIQIPIVRPATAAWLVCGGHVAHSRGRGTLRAFDRHDVCIAEVGDLMAEPARAAKGPSYTHPR